MSDNKDTNTIEEKEKKPVEEVKEDVAEEVKKDEVEEVSQEEIKEDVVEEKEEKKEKEKEELPNFRPGDTVKIYYRIVEGTKTRIQPYEGIVISKKGKEECKTFTVRRIGAGSIGVERIFPLHSPNIEKIEIKKRGKVRRAKLYYLRDKKGREAMRIKELKSKK